MFLESRREDKRFWTEWKQALQVSLYIEMYMVTSMRQYFGVL
jgi:hypothetical protein